MVFKAVLIVLHLKLLKMSTNILTILIYASFLRILNALAIASLALACCSANEWA